MTTATATAEKPRLQIANIFWITFVHLACLLAIPYFSWDGLALSLILLFTMSPLGVTLTYHRMLSHKAFKTPKWLEYTLATIGTLAAQGPILLWVAEHRLHHRYSDTEKDPHDSNRGFFFSHVGHLFYHKEFEDVKEQWMKYVPDLASQPYYRFLNTYSIPIAVSALIPLYYFGGIGYVVWGGFVRVMLMLHITWFVNSATHTFGYKNFETRDRSTNCWWVGLLAAGEGWHNNHHAHQTCAAHGRRWFEFDLTWQIIRVLRAVGLAYDVKGPEQFPAPAGFGELVKQTSSVEPVQA